MNRPHRTHPVFTFRDCDAYVAVEHLGITDADIPASTDDLMLVDVDRAHELGWDVSRPTTKEKLFYAPNLGGMGSVTLKNVELMAMAPDGRFTRIATLSSTDVLHVAVHAARRAVEDGHVCAEHVLTVLARHANADVVTRRLLELARASNWQVKAAKHVARARQRLSDVEALAREHFPLPADLNPTSLAAADDEWYLRVLHSASRLYPAGTSRTAALHRMSGKSADFDAAHAAFWSRSRMREDLVDAVWKALPTSTAVHDDPTGAAQYCVDPIAYAQTPGSRAYLFADRAQLDVYGQHVLSLAAAIVEVEPGADPGFDDERAAAFVRALQSGAPVEELARLFRGFGPVWRIALLRAVGEAQQRTLIEVTRFCCDHNNPAG